ncbi:potassium channel family protein [Gelidibacter salicanalis]|uniref:Two pore domain potassium channel family protein n=1 Tax=Gelidibacter salicanalis TaxID=291193 RepID=A0A934NKP3_9FLAO|nr:potassium channel family protein [Gelidibacter salicanalis]MBJ7881642.1 two pore domain potassium channel family protein [Gelidibacter salicanalis]
MNYILLSVGALLYFGVISDIIMTTLTVKGGGWMTSKISHWLWNVFFVLSGRNGKSSLLTHAGYVLLVTVMMVWVIALNSSFILILMSETDAIINSTTKLPADIWQKIYYSGFVLSTLGLGDYIPSSNFWRIVTILFSFTGLIFITMSITYFIPVLSAVIKKRKLGIELSSLGDSPQDIVINAMSVNDFDHFKFHMLTLSSDLVEHSENHKAYPVIHFFHNNNKENAIILQIAKLNEAIYIIKNYVNTDVEANIRLLSNMESAINNYIEVVIEVGSAQLKDYNVDKIKMNELKRKGLLKPNLQNKKPDKKMQRRQSVLYTLIKYDGWEWNDVIQ